MNKLIDIEKFDELKDWVKNAYCIVQFQKINETKVSFFSIQNMRIRESDIGSNYKILTSYGDEFEVYDSSIKVHECWKEDSKGYLIEQDTNIINEKIKPSIG